jgi:regulator of sigma E protease
MPSLVDGPVTVGGVLEDSPAEQAGLKVGDRIASVDGKSVQSFVDLLSAVQGSQGKPLVIALERAKGDVVVQEGQAAPADQLTITVQPSLDAASELDVIEGRPTQQTYRIGITRSMDHFTYEPATAAEAAIGAWQQVTGLSTQILRSLKGLITGQISARKSIGGPIAIIKQTASSAQKGWLALVGIMIFLNITLAIMNLLPIPVLDGGHLTLFTIEQLRGRPLTMKFQAAVTNVGLVILLSLMVFAIGNDLVRALL